MKTSITCFICLITSALLGQNWQWANAFDTKAGGSISSIKYTPTNQIVASGLLKDTVHIGNATLLPPGNSAYGFIAKYENDGLPIWAKPIYVNKGNSAQNSIYNFYNTKTPDNHTVLSSHFAGTIVLGSDTLVEGSTGATFIAKLDSMGNYVWAKKFGAPDVPGSNAMQLSPPAVDNLGNIYQACTFNSTAYFETDTLAGANGGIYIVKLNKDGEELWVRQCGGQYGWHRTYDLVTDYEGNIYLTGTMSGLAHFGQDTFQVNNTRTASYLAKLDGDGNFLWAKMQGATTKNDVSGQIGSNTYGVGIASAGQMVTLTGFFMDTVQIANQTLSPLCGNDFCLNFFLVSYDGSGNPLWVKQAPATTSGSNGVNILADPNANLFVGGNFRSNLSFDGQSVSSVVMAQGYDKFLAKFDTAGICQWILNIDNNGNSFAMDAACPYDNIIIGSDWQYNPGNLASAGLGYSPTRDVFIASLEAGYDCMLIASDSHQEVSVSNQVQVYPNPASDFLHVAIEGNAPSGKISLTDIMGRTLLQIEATEPSFDLPIGHLTDGIYWLNFTAVNGERSKAMAILKKSN